MTTKKNDNYITLTEMADGFSEYNQPQTEDFIGKDLSIYLDDGNELRYHFSDKTNLKYEVVGGPDNGLTGQASYIATKARENIYYLSYLHKNKDLVSIVLDYNKNMASVIFSIFPTDDTDKLPIFKRVMADMPAYATKYYLHHASINTPYQEGVTPIHEYTYDLAGKNAVYQYSQKDAYLHTYYDVDLFTWYCFSGNEKGLGDTDFAKFLKLGDNLYLIIWIEKILQVVSTIILDFDAKLTTGSMATYEGKDYHGNILNVPSGAKITKVDGVNVVELEKLLK